MKDIFKELKIDKIEFEKDLVREIQLKFKEIDKKIFEIDSYAEINNQSEELCLYTFSETLKEKRQRSLSREDLTYEMVEDNLEYFFSFIESHSLKNDELGINILTKLYIIAIAHLEIPAQYIYVLDKLKTSFAECTRSTLAQAIEKLLIDEAVKKAKSVSDFYSIYKLDIAQSQEIYKKAEELATTYSELIHIGKVDEANSIKTPEDFHDELIDGLAMDIYGHNIMFSQEKFDEVTAQLFKKYDTNFIMELALCFSFENCLIGEEYLGDGEWERDDYSYELGVEFYKQWQNKLIDSVIKNAKQESDLKDIVSWSEDIFGEILSIEEITKKVDDAIIDYKNMSREDAIEIIKNLDADIYFELKKYHDDEGVTLEAVKKDGWLLTCASQRLKADKSLAMQALKTKPEIIEHLSEDLKDDIEIARLAVSNNAFALKHLSKRLRDEREIVDIALDKDIYCYKYIGEGLKDDRELYDKALENEDFFAFGDEFGYLSDKFKSDKVEVLKALKRELDSFEHIAYELKFDKDVLDLVYEEYDKEIVDIYLNQLKSPKEIY